MNSKIKLATIEDLSTAKSLTERCAQAMISKGIYQWNEHYPSKEKLKDDIVRNELYKIEVENALRGIMVLSPIMDEEYIPVEWLTPNSDNLYIHRLATDPKFWGKGFGRQLMGFAEDVARENKFTSIRLDTFSKNFRNQQFYEIRGYKRLGDIYFPNQSEYPFYCYELVL